MDISVSATEKNRELGTPLISQLGADEPWNRVLDPTTLALEAGHVAASASAAIASPPRYYRPELDVLRFIALGLVFNHHLLFKATDDGASFSIRSALQESGAAGVCLFFLLSAFLITDLLLREKEKTGTVSLSAFYIRRILRIWPLYLWALAIATVLPHFVHSWSYAGSLIPYYLLFCGNWINIYRGGWFHDPAISPLWSICIEEQFYLIWPALALLRGNRGILRASAGILPLAWSTVFLLSKAHVSKAPGLWLNSVNQFQFFALGAILAIALKGREIRISIITRIGLVILGLTSFVLAAYPFHYINDRVHSTPTQMLSGYLFIDLGCLVLFCAFYDASLSHRAGPFIYLGKISFGLYIYHYVIYALAAGAIETLTHSSRYDHMGTIYVITAIGSIITAHLSYLCLERPVLRFKSRFAIVPSRPV